MPEDKKKYGWTEKGILGFIFAPLGLIFVITGALVLRYADLTPDDRLAFWIAFVGLGSAFLVTALILLGLDLRRRARLRAVYEGGFAVKARIAGVIGNNRINLNGTHPAMVECHYTDPATGTVHVYYSRYLYVSVQDILQQEEVPLYLDPGGDLSVGFVDIDAVLPKITVHR